MTKFMAAMVACSVAILTAPGVFAGTIYKCNVGGKIAYGDQPCAGGSGTELAIQAAPPVDPAAAEKLASDKLRLLAVEKTRAADDLREERERQRAARVYQAQKQKCDRLRLKQKWVEEDLGRARGDAVAAARQKAQRQAQALAVECPA